MCRKSGRLGVDINASGLYSRGEPETSGAALQNHLPEPRVGQRGPGRGGGGRDCPTRLVPQALALRGGGCV